MASSKLPHRGILVYYGGVIIFTMMCVILILSNFADHEPYVSQPKLLKRENIHVNVVNISIEEASLISQDAAEVKPITTLLVTTPRSGSSWIGKLLDMIDDSFYLYEPIHSVKRDKLDFTVGFDVVQQILNCGISEELAKDIQSWPAMYKPKNCSGNRKTCSTAKEIAHNCQNSKYRSVKVVRLRLSIVENLLNLKSLEALKIIYLVRDPRGSLSSIDNVRNQRGGWTEWKPIGVCAKLREDIYSFQILSKLYPNNIILVRYEDVALDPFNKSQAIWNFLNDNQDLPQPQNWHTYLKNSQVEKKITTDPYDNKHKSTKDWQLWRKTINEKLYNEIVNNCDDVINILGYKLFDSFTQMRKSTETALSVQSCNSLPCNS